MNRLSISLFLCVIVLPFIANGQSDSITYNIKTMDGNAYQGTIVQKEVDYLLLKTENLGTITIQFDDVKMMERLNGPNWQRRPNKSIYQTSGSLQEASYFVSPSGYGLKKGEASYQNYMLFINQVHFGFTDYFSLGIGLIPIGEGAIPVWIAPKFSIPLIKDLVNVGVGSLNGFLLGQESFGAYYGQLTIGPRAKKFSVGIGKSYENGRLSDMAYALSGSFQLGDRAYLITENFAVEDVSMGLVGGRHNFVNVGFEYGLVYWFEQRDDFFIAFPFAGIKIPFYLK